MDAEVIFFLSGKRIELSLRAEEQLGLTELTVVFRSFFVFEHLFSFLCAPTSIFFAFLSKKVPEKGVAFQIFYISLHADTHSAHAELMLSFSKREIVETRTWEGSGIMT